MTNSLHSAIRRNEKRMRPSLKVMPEQSEGYEPTSLASE